MLTGMMGFERHERIGCGWDGTALHGDPLRSSDGWALFWVADDPLCDGWWMVDGGGAGSRGLGWPRLDGVLPLTLTHSPVSRLSRWLGWPRSSACASRRTTPPARDPFGTFEAHHASDMRAPDSRGFMRERVRRVSGEDIRGDARARSPHGLCGRAWTAGGSHEADTCMRGACESCSGRVGWYAETHRLRTVAIPVIARDERRESE